MQIILASSSPRRKDLLSLVGVAFDIIAPISNEETRHKESPVEHVRRLALEKAQSVASRYPDSLVLGCDTVIEIDSQILGKPENIQQAEKMLNLLRGRCHQVHTGLALVCLANQMEETHVESVKVWIKAFTDSILDQYLKTKDSLGKAGAYSIQGEGAHLIEKIEGDYPTVVCLPLWYVAKLLERHGVALPKSVEEIYRTKPYANWKDFD